MGDMYGEGADAYAAEVRQRKEWLAAMTPTERANYNRAMIPQSPPPPRELRPDEVEYILPGLEALEKARGRYFRYNNNYKPDTKEWTPFTSGYGPLITPTITYLFNILNNNKIIVYKKKIQTIEDIKKAIEYKRKKALEYREAAKKAKEEKTK